MKSKHKHALCKIDFKGVKDVQVEVDTLRAIFVKKYPDKREMFKNISVLNKENSAIFLVLGPVSDIAQINPGSLVANLFKQAIRIVVLPNNRMIKAIINKNKVLLNKNEKELCDTFIEHSEGYERFKKTNLDKDMNYLRYPGKFGDMVSKY